MCWNSIQNQKSSQNLDPALLRAKFHLHNSLADNINDLPIRKAFVASATAMYLQGDLDGLKNLVNDARNKLQEELQGEIQNSNKSSYRI